MNSFNRRFLIVAALVLIFTGLNSRFETRSHATNTAVDITQIPLRIGEWTAKELPIDQLTTDVLETDSVLMRIYKNAQGREVVLAIVYYQDNRVALHLPESCYSGAGSFIVGRDIVPIPLADETNFRANHLTIRGNKGNQVAVYYFETSNARTPSYKDMRWQRMINKVKSKSNNGALVRFSTASTRSPDEDVALVKEFIQEISPVLTEYLFKDK